MAACKRCLKKSRIIPEVLPFCPDCIKNHYEEISQDIEKIHHSTRAEFDLPQSPPRSAGGITCPLCVNACRAGEREFGYCGVRKNAAGKWEGASEEQASLSWYHDALPTNCVADWVCPAGGDVGYPKYSHCRGAEYHYYNLAAFFNSCTLNCLFCQNWHYRQSCKEGVLRSLAEFLDSISPKDACICWFGGDPGSQIDFALNASKKALDKNKGRILRICWETNGTVNGRYLEEMAELSLISGGCIKFDLKAWNENIHKALTGFSNKRTLENFEMVSHRVNERPQVPLLIASTLLVPGYIDEQEVAGIAGFIASLNKEIPYSLLGFHPDFYLTDLPRTSIAHAEHAYQAARNAGLSRLNIGNMAILSRDY